MMSRHLKLVKTRAGYFVVTYDTVVVGRCERERNGFSARGYAGWKFTPNNHGRLSGWEPIWETTARRAAEAALRIASGGVAA